MKDLPRWEIPPELQELGQFDAVKTYESVVKEYKRAGKDVYAFLGSDPAREGFVNKPLSEALVEAANNATESYPSGTTLFEDLRQSISNFEAEHRDVKCPPEDIILGPGVAGCWNTVQYSMLAENDEIITFDPIHYLSGPAKYVHIFGSRIVTCRTIEEDRWRPDFQDLRKKITDKTKAIVICNPNNPTGAVWNAKTLETLVDIAGEHEIPVVSDEIYGLITYDDIEARSILVAAKDVPSIMLSGMSKFFMRTGWRIGYACFNDPNELIDQIFRNARTVESMYGHGIKLMPTPILYAAVKAYQNYHDAFKAGKDTVNETQKHRDFIIKRLAEIQGISCVKPEGALYALPKISGIGTRWKTDLDFALDLLKEEQVIWHIGSRYGKHGFGHVRILLQPSLTRLDEALNRLERFMRKRLAS
jgi:aspartate/methionine/tyrosine aminotransferase